MFRSRAVADDRNKRIELTTMCVNANKRASGKATYAFVAEIDTRILRFVHLLSKPL